MTPPPSQPYRDLKDIFDMDPSTRAQLLANEARCEELHIKVSVDSVSREHKVALCSAYQTSRRFGRRVYTTSQLLDRAEWALAPLRRMGITPMLNVRGWPRETSTPLSRSSNALVEWMQRLWARPGITAPSSLPTPLAIPPRRDPFGLRDALNKALDKVARTPVTVPPVRPV